MDREMVDTTGRDRLHVSVQRYGTKAVVAPAGELDHHTADLLREPLDTLIEDGFGTLVVDCTQLEFCDSTGLNVLLGTRLKVEAAGGAVHLAGMKPAVAKVFAITGAEAVFTVHDTLDDALKE
ncbi:MULTISPECIES: STAS domain-containing protein [Streptomycetaceae]|uniref:STAS domain-containing protein n=1 Tax=Streptomycetaceae TaxID=2062 RepID=UPI000373A6F1|nr:MULTISPECIES: STAS domain-containing protein [Streptomycetaceae]MYX37309.1 anti-sigma factor antagonist [Streptomyces sp. SID8377]